MLNSDKKITITSSGTEKYIDECLSISKELNEYFTEDAITTLSQDLIKHSLFVALNSNELAGFTTIHKKSKYVAEVLFTAVKREYNRQGIGSALVDYVVNALKSEGVRLLEVKTLSEDVDYFPYEKTRRFWKKNGFMLLETIDPFPGWEPGSPCAIYVRIL